MEAFLYNGCGKVVLSGETYFVTGLDRGYKTKTITNRDGFKKVLKREEIRISVKTHWRISGHYDLQFDGFDAACYVCNSHHMDYTEKCKCEKMEYTVDEYLALVPSIRKAYVLYWMRSKVTEKQFEELKSVEPKYFEECMFDDTDTRRNVKISQHTSESEAYKLAVEILSTKAAHQLKNK